MLHSKNTRTLSLQIDIHLRLSNMKTNHLLRKKKITRPQIRFTIIPLHVAHWVTLQPKKVWKMMMKCAGRELLGRLVSRPQKWPDPTFLAFQVPQEFQITPQNSKHRKIWIHLRLSHYKLINSFQCSNRTISRSSCQQMEVCSRRGLSKDSSPRWIICRPTAPNCSTTCKTWSRWKRKLGKAKCRMRTTSKWFLWSRRAVQAQIRWATSWVVITLETQVKIWTWAIRLATKIRTRL